MHEKKVKIYILTLYIQYLHEKIIKHKTIIKYKHNKGGATMPVIKLPYGARFSEVDIPEERLNGILVSKLHHYKPQSSQEEPRKTSP